MIEPCSLSALTRHTTTWKLTGIDCRRGSATSVIASPSPCGFTKPWARNHVCTTIRNSNLYDVKQLSEPRTHMCAPTFRASNLRWIVQLSEPRLPGNSARLRSGDKDQAAVVPSLGLGVAASFASKWSDIAADAALREEKMEEVRSGREVDSQRQTFTAREGTAISSQGGASPAEASDHIDSGSNKEVAKIRRRLSVKLSEANNYNRYLLREMGDRDKTINECQRELVAMERELQSLKELAQEVARDAAPVGLRKINGKYVSSYVALRLEVLHGRVVEQLKDVDLMHLREVPLTWYGMAEDVKVMGSFDGWTHGEQLAPESTGSFTKFAAFLRVRPGRYEIKFQVNGEWMLSPDFPVVGEGLVMNNLLVVD